MPFAEAVDRSNRLVLAVGKDTIGLEDLAVLAQHAVLDDTLALARLLDMTRAQPGFTAREFDAWSRLLPTLQPGTQAGPVAFVADPRDPAWTRLFGELADTANTTPVFSSLRDARQWLAAEMNLPEWSVSHRTPAGERRAG